MGNQASASIPSASVFEVASDTSGSVPHLSSNILYLFSSDFDYLQSFVRSDLP